MIDHQLNIFHGSPWEPLADSPASIGQSVTQPTDASAEAASRRDTPHDHAGQPGDDGSLHYMLTGQPESEAAA